MPPISRKECSHPPHLHSRRHRPPPPTLPRFPLYYLAAFPYTNALFSGAFWRAGCGRGTGCSSFRFLPGRQRGRRYRPSELLVWPTSIALMPSHYGFWTLGSSVRMWEVSMRTRQSELITARFAVSLDLWPQAIQPPN